MTVLNTPDTPAAGTEQKVLTGINLGLAILTAILGDLVKANAIGEVISAVETAIEKLQTVQGTDVTFAQLEALRTHPLWPAAVVVSAPAPPAADAAPGHVAVIDSRTGQRIMQDGTAPAERG